MEKVIILIDGAFFTKKFEKSQNHFPKNTDVELFVKCLLEKSCNNYFFLRAYYYDCPPLDNKITLPISKKSKDLSKTDRFRENTTLLNGLKRTDFFSVREGFLSEDGWILKKSALKKLTKENAGLENINDSDFSPNINQKGVDMKIGLDIAWISLEKIAQRIILVTGDSDFIPAIKFARRSGIQVFLATLNHGVSQNLLDHADCLFTQSIEKFLKS
jgi:uncharacterized LabA/DUF88 family protein